MKTRSHILADYKIIIIKKDQKADCEREVPFITRELLHNGISVNFVI